LFFKQTGLLGRRFDGSVFTWGRLVKNSINQNNTRGVCPLNGSVFKKTNTTGVVLIDRDFSPTDPM